MRKIIITGAALTLMCGTAFAQSTMSPQGDNMNKPGTHSGTMHKGEMKNGSMGTTTGQAGGSKPNGTAGGPTSLSGTGSSGSGAGAGGSPGSSGAASGQ